MVFVLTVFKTSFLCMRHEMGSLARRHGMSEDFFWFSFKPPRKKIILASAGLGITGAFRYQSYRHGSSLRSCKDCTLATQVEDTDVLYYWRSHLLLRFLARLDSCQPYSSGSRLCTSTFIHYDGVIVSRSHWKLENRLTFLPPICFHFF